MLTLTLPLHTYSYVAAAVAATASSQATFPTYLLQLDSLQVHYNSLMLEPDCLLDPFTLITSARIQLAFAFSQS